MLIHMQGTVKVHQHHQGTVKVHRTKLQGTVIKVHQPFQVMSTIMITHTTQTLETKISGINNTIQGITIMVPTLVILIMNSITRTP